MYHNIRSKVHLCLVIYLTLLTYANAQYSHPLQNQLKVFDDAYDLEYDLLLQDNELYPQGDMDQSHILELLANPESIRRTAISFGDLAPLYLPSTNDTINTDCRRDLDALSRALTKPFGLITNLTFWPLELVDSWGKVEDGFLAGNINYLGFFYECLLLDVDDQNFDAHFQGQYCSMAYGKEPNVSEANVHDPRMPIATLPIPSSIPLHIKSYATCMPSTCTKEELVTSVNKVLDLMDQELKVTECQTLDQINRPKLGAAEISGILIFGLLGALLIVASGMDAINIYFKPGYMANGWQKYLLVFSVIGNLKKIFHVETKSDGKFITCIHGIRFLSICWVIIGHQWVFTTAQAINPMPAAQYIPQPMMFQILANAFLSVDTFFFMSGLLVAFGFMNLAHKSGGKFNPLMYYVHRVVRLMPPILIAAAFMATLSGLFVVGPISWQYKEHMLETCRKNWWHDPLFLTNIFQMSSSNPNITGSCLGQCWYVAADTQMYIFMPLLLLPLAWWPKKGLIWLSLWTFISCMIPAIITAIYELPPTILVGNMQPIAHNDLFKKIYVVPWSRASPYLVGAWTGYLLFASSGVDKRIAFTPKMNLVQALIGWIVALTAGFAVLFGMWHFNDGMGAKEVPRATAIIYAGLHRAVWAIMLGWIVCACHWGYGGPINWFLSHPSWQPFSRLTYSFYLVSLPIQYILISSTHKYKYYSNLNKVIETAGVLLISFLPALILTLVSESPTVALEKLLLKPQEKKEDLGGKEEDHNSDNDFEEEVEKSIQKRVELQRSFSEQKGINFSFA